MFITKDRHAFQKFSTPIEQDKNINLEINIIFQFKIVFEILRVFTKLLL